MYLGPGQVEYNSEWRFPSNDSQQYVVGSELDGNSANTFGGKLQSKDFNNIFYLPIGIWINSKNYMIRW